MNNNNTLKAYNNKEPKPTVSILGCGWLGKALTKQLVKRNYTVVASTQHPQNVDELTQLGAVPNVFSLTSTTPLITPANVDLFQQHCLIIAIPPGIRKGKKDYPEKITHAVKLAEMGLISQLILISSTAVYNGLSGNVNEEASLDLSSEKVCIIHKAEQEALKFKGHTIILRLSGLVGENRHPGNFLRGGKLLSDPQAPINLIHQDDVVGVLLKLIQTQEHSAIYNASSLTHVAKREYYQQAARVLSLPKPIFKEVSKKNNNLQHSIESKKINSTKIRDTLDYQFVHDDLLKWLSQPNLSL